MKTSLLPAAAALLLAGTGCGSRSAAPAPEPIRLIVETDMGNDIDDALAFDLIYKAMDDGRVDLLAIGNHKLSPTATDYIDILNTWYGGEMKKGMFRWRSRRPRCSTTTLPTTRRRCAR